MKTHSAIAAVLFAATLSLAQTAPSQTAPKTATPAASKPTTAAKPQTAKHVSKSSKKKSARHAKPQPQKVVEVAPQPPPPPPTLAQQPPVAPRVIYQNGLLSIDAPNSTLGDILGGIRRATGATIDGPSGLADRMIVHLGPGQPRQVVASLLGTSRFDYIVMGTPQQPDGINRLVLMARQQSGQPSTPVVSGGLPQQQARPAVAANTDEEDEEAPERDENADGPPSQPVVAEPSPQPQQQQPPQQPQYPLQQQMPPDQVAPPQGQQNQVQQDQTAPKTPEQLYKELQELERQRQQPQNQNQTPPPPTPPQ